MNEAMATFLSISLDGRAEPCCQAMRGPEERARYQGGCTLTLPLPEQTKEHEQGEQAGDSSVPSSLSLGPQSSPPLIAASFALHRRWRQHGPLHFYAGSTCDSTGWSLEKAEFDGVQLIQITA